MVSGGFESLVANGGAGNAMKIRESFDNFAGGIADELKQLNPKNWFTKKGAENAQGQASADDYSGVPFTALKYFKPNSYVEDIGRSLISFDANKNYGAGFRRTPAYGSYFDRRYV